MSTFNRWDSPFVLTEVGGMCPTQAEGVFYGFPFYFRARHGDWSLSVALPGHDPVGDALVYYAEGDDPTSGYMEPGPVLAILAAHWAEFMRREIHLAGYAYEMITWKSWTPPASDSAAKP